MKRLLIASLAVLVPAIASADWRMVVRLKPGQTLAVAQSTAASLGGTVVDSTPNAPFALFSLPSDPLTYAVAQYAIATGVIDVLWAGDDVALWSAESVSRGGQLSVISRGGQLSVIEVRNTLTEMNAPVLSQVSWSPSLADSDGRTVKVAILDTGLSRRQTALWSKVDASYDVFGGDADDKPMGRDSNGSGTLDDGVGHGTMVAGIVNTIAPKVRLVVAKVADSDGRASAWGIVKGLAFAVAQGAEIANVSLGSEDALPAYSAMAEWCRTKGLLVVSASGNEDENHAYYPSRDPITLCVTGVNPDDTKAWFSNYDSKVVSGAPAVNVVSQWWDGGLAAWSGTSFASPFVAAALADCLRRTTPKSGTTLINAVAASGRNADGANAPQYRGKLGTVLDIVRLNGILSGTP